MAFVKLISDRPDEIERAVQEYAAKLRKRPEVQRVIWFGSRVNGRPMPGSDVDLLIVLAASDLTWRDRISEYLPGAFPVGLDLFPYTESELARLRANSPQWHAAMHRGQEV